MEGFFYPFAENTPLADKIITLDSQAPYTEPLFSLWLGLSIAVLAARQYNENCYHSKNA
jgi:hypothetical protein